MSLLDRLNSKLGPLSIAESRPARPIETLNKIATSGIFKKTIKVFSLADGAAGLFRDADGQAYEVIVRPAESAQHKSLYPGGVVSRKQLKQP